MAKVYRLPEALREKLARPMGRLYTAPEIAGGGFVQALASAGLLATVGDRVTDTLGAKGKIPDIQVVDSRENRRERSPPNVAYSRLIEVDNPPGTITADAIEGIREAFEGPKPARVAVRGEEDLLAIPVIALAPVSALVLYGQPGEGIVTVRADADAKSRTRVVLAELGITEIA